MQGILPIAREAAVPVIVDVKDLEVKKYKGAYLLKPNLNKLKQMNRLSES